MKTPLLPTREVLRQLRWPNAKKLRRWVKLGLLDPPTMGKPESAERGRAAYWPAHIVPLCDRIAVLHSSGQSLQEALDIARGQLQNDGWFSEMDPFGGGVRVIAVIPYFRPRIGGVENHTKSLATELAKRGHCICIFTQRLPATPAYEAGDGLRVYRFGIPNRKNRCSEGYEQMLRRVQVHSAENLVIYLCLSVGKEYRTDLMLEILKVARLRGIPRIVRIPSSGRATELANAHPDNLEELHHADRVIALNPGIRDELIAAGCDAARIIALPNGVDLKLFHPVPSAGRRDLRAGLGAASADRVFVSPSRFAPKKKIPKLIRLWKQLQSAVKVPTKLWIIGNATHEPKKGVVSRAIAAAMEEAGVGSVQLFPGRPQQEIPPFYQAADAYVSLSTQEGQSNALLEAMACRLPIVAPDTPAVSQVVKDGVNGFLFDPCDPQSALDALSRCAAASDSQLASMGRHNMAVIAREYTVDLMASRFSALLRELLPEGAANGRS